MVHKSDNPLQDEDFVIDKDDGGSPTDDSGEGESDGSDGGDEEVTDFFFYLYTMYSFLWC